MFVNLINKPERMLDQHQQISHANQDPEEANSKFVQTISYFLETTPNVEHLIRNIHELRKRGCPVDWICARRKVT